VRLSVSRPPTVAADSPTRSAIAFALAVNFGFLARTDGM
jgi:hypothetical protein